MVITLSGSGPLYQQVFRAIREAILSGRLRSGDRLPVSRVLAREARDGRLAFEVESLQGRHIRADLARAVVSAGWDLNEMRPVGLSLEDIFLQLTAAENKAQAVAVPVTE